MGEAGADTSAALACTKRLGASFCVVGSRAEARSENGVPTGGAAPSHQLEREVPSRLGFALAEVQVEWVCVGRSRVVVDDVPPERALRQWVLTSPHPWRSWLGRNGELPSKATRLLVRTVLADLERAASIR